MEIPREVYIAGWVIGIFAVILIIYGVNKGWFKRGR